MPTPYAPASGKRKPKLAALPRKKLVRDLDQNAGAVAGLRIAAAGAAMGQVEQHFNSLANDVVALCPAMLATNPMPQASCSLRGSYSP